MVFLAPAALAGLAAVAAPVAIHLLNKRKVKVVRWGAMRFLQATVQKNQKRFQLEQLLLLAARCLLLVLLALAFARPVLNPGGTDGAAAGGPNIAVYLLDQSASMGQSNGVQTRFELAKAAALKSLDALPAGSQAALFLVANRPNPVVPQPTANLPLVRRAVELAEQTVRRNDYLAAVQLALSTLKPISGVGKEIVLFTDDQAAAWQEAGAIREALDAAPEVRLRVVPAGERGEDNLAITALRPETSVPAAGQVVPCLVEVTNFSSAPATAVRVTLAIDDAPPADEHTIERIEPGKASTVRLNVRFARAGYYVLTAAIPADRFPADDHRAAAVHVIERRDIAVVEGSPANAAPQDRDAFFLANALVPVPPARRPGYFLKVDAEPPAWLGSAELGRYPVIFLSDVAAPDANASQRLLKCVQDGGGLVIFPGPRVQPDAYNNEPSLRQLLPAKLGAKRELGRNAPLLAWQSAGYPHPVTSLWNDPQNGNLGGVRVSQYFPLQPPPTSADGVQRSTTLASYTDGTPAAVERPFGKGRVVLFGIPATTRWSNLPIHPDFVPLLRRLTDYLSPDGSAASLAVVPGSAFQQNVPGELSGRELSVIRPGGVTRPAGNVEINGQEAVVRYRDTGEAGGYRLKVAGEPNAVAAFAVNVDPAESDLRTVEPEKLAALTRENNAAAGGKAGQPAAGAASAPVQTTTHQAGVRREFWTLLVCCAGVLALVEMALAHRLSLPR